MQRKLGTDLLALIKKKNLSPPSSTVNAIKLCLICSVVVVQTLSGPTIPTKNDMAAHVVRSDGAPKI